MAASTLSLSAGSMGFAPTVSGRSTVFSKKLEHAQRVHVHGIFLGLTWSTISTLGPPYVLQWYLDPLGWMWDDLRRFVLFEFVSESKDGRVPTFQLLLYDPLGGPGYL